MKRKKYVWLAALVCMAIGSYASRQLLNEVTDAPVPVYTDSADRLQTFLNEQYKIVADYNRYLFSKQEAAANISELGRKGKETKDSLQKLWSGVIGWIHGKAAKEPDEQIRRTLSDYMQLVSKLEQQVKDIGRQLDSNSNNIIQFDGQINSSKEKYTEVVKRLTELTRRLNGAGELIVDKISYRYFIVTKGEHAIRVHNPKSGPSSIEGIKQQLLKAKTEPLMITNGGMFAPGFKPQGLLIEDFKKCSNLDTLKPDNRIAMNFYLMPNGVFYTDSAGAGHVIETDSFLHVFPARLKPMYATQSGPMLLSNNQLNKNFKAGSSNLNIRSGVGKSDDGKSIFVISDSPVNFFDFALTFKEVFGCKNALYLDGAISQMYIPEKLLKKQKAGNGEFGPMISITAKKK
jgi:uncharacterized protein YigE (DUF2233 family)/predicted DNA-binding transcriptional regulator